MSLTKVSEREKHTCKVSVWDPLDACWSSWECPPSLSHEEP